METIRILQRAVGFSNVYLVKNGSNSILVDAGLSGKANKIELLLREERLQAHDIKLIVLTHTHYDHTGNLEQIAKLTGAPVLVHKNEFENLKNGFTPIPTGQGFYTGIISKLGRKFYPNYASPQPFKADLINEESYTLEKFGITGKILSTPGHSEGSQSVLIGDKLIAGDTFFHLKNNQFFPPFANSPQELLKTWEQLFRMNIKTVYPGHGKPFAIEEAIPEYEKWKKKLAS